VSRGGGRNGQDDRGLSDCAREGRADLSSLAVAIARMPPAPIFSVSKAAKAAGSAASRSQRRWGRKQVIGGAREPRSIAKEAASEAFLAASVAAPRWPRRWRFLFIVGAASLAWIVPALLLYLLFAR